MRLPIWTSVVALVLSLVTLGMVVTRHEGTVTAQDQAVAPVMVTEVLSWSLIETPPVNIITSYLTDGSLHLVLSTPRVMAIPGGITGFVVVSPQQYNTATVQTIVPIEAYDGVSFVVEGVFTRT